jgi:arabinofuranosyltransferase
MATVAVAAAAIVLVLVPFVNGVALSRFTIDDSYINFRYSENLAAGHGLTWNHVGNHIGGYTTFLWVVLLAGVKWIGIGTAVASKVLGLAAAVALMLVLTFHGGRRLPVVRPVAVAGLALSPAFLLLAVQGLDTALASLLATVCAILLIATVERPSHGNLAAFFGVCLLTVLTRPDLFPLCAVLVAGLGLWLVRLRDGAALRRGLAWLGAAIALGLCYLAWRWSYYGLPAPNPYYVKRSSGLVDPDAAANLGGFLKHMAAPYLALVIGLYAWSWRSPSAHTRSERYAIGVVLAAVIAFLGATLLFKPIQGYLWRYQMPAYPVILLLLVSLASRVSLPPVSGRRRTVALAAVGLTATALVAFPFNTADRTRTEVAERWGHDRKAVGEALAAYRNDGLRMFVSEAGALPLFSRWWASDSLGLSDEEIARHGASLPYLRRMSPDLVMFLSYLKVRPAAAPADIASYGDPIYRLLRSGDYVFAAAVAKSDPNLRAVRNQGHFYFVKRSSPRAQELVRTLRGLDDVRYLPAAGRQPFLDALDLPGRSPGDRAGPLRAAQSV